MKDDGDDAADLTADDLVSRAGALLSQGGTLESSARSGAIADEQLTKAVAATLQKLAPGGGQAGAQAQPGPAEAAAAKRIADTARAATAKAPPHRLSEDDTAA